MSSFALAATRVLSPSRRRTPALAVLLFFSLLGAPSAHAVMIPWSVEGVTTVAPGGGGAYNLTVNLIAASNTIDLTENVSQTIGLQDFNWSMSANNTGEAYAAVDRSLTVGGVPLTIDQDYLFGSTAGPFGLIVKGGRFPLAPTLVFNLGNSGIVDVTLLEVVQPGGGGSIGTTATSGSGLTSATSSSYPYGTGLVATFLLHDVVVPEPSTALLLAAGLTGLAATGRRRSLR